jgi:hypothetical protein
MNERIKELADNATRYAIDICNHDANADWYEVRDTKFAELVEAAAVAREREACAKLCEENMFFATGEQHAKAIRARKGSA